MKKSSAQGKLEEEGSKEQMEQIENSQQGNKFQSSRINNHTKCG